MMTRLQVWEKTGGLCFYCGKRVCVPAHCELLPPDAHGEAGLALPSWASGMMETDHVDPARGRGRNRAENLVPSCGPCNALKSNRSIEAFRTLALKKRPDEFVDGFWFEKQGASA